METVFEPDSGRVPLTETRLHEIEEALRRLLRRGQMPIVPMPTQPKRLSSSTFTRPSFT